MARCRPVTRRYRALAGVGITTVVDLRAEDLSAAQLAAVRESAVPAPWRRRIS
ncbi:hypothetical protein [Streptomyces canus]|uniref:hypothetical protein n=1 Tax=Streptomyces canus TaxID=58343 RepID=UPI003F4CD2E4